MSEIDAKDKRQFKRAVATLNKILEEVRLYCPDAIYHIEGDEMELLEEPHNPQAKNKRRKILARSPLVGYDG